MRRAVLAVVTICLLLPAVAVARRGASGKEHSALVAAAGFVYMLVSRKGALREIRYAAVILVVGIGIYLVRSWRRQEWPFGESEIVVGR